MLVFAKGVSSGLHAGGRRARGERVWEPFWADGSELIFRHGLTYSGHASACAAAIANLDVLERERLVDRVAELEPALVSELAPLAEHTACRRGSLRRRPARGHRARRPGAGARGARGLLRARRADTAAGAEHASGLTPVRHHAATTWRGWPPSSARRSREPECGTCASAPTKGPVVAVQRGDALEPLDPGSVPAALGDGRPAAGDLGTAEDCAPACSGDTREGRGDRAELQGPHRRDRAGDA